MEKVTKAELVRGMIFAAKQQNKDAVSLIADVMQHFGFGRQLARTYILKNWERVQVAAAQAEAQATVQAELETAKEQTKRALSMSKDAIRKREQRAAKRAAAAAAVA